MEASRPRGSRCLSTAFIWPITLFAGQSVRSFRHGTGFQQDHLPNCIILLLLLLRHTQSIVCYTTYNLNEIIRGIIGNKILSVSSSKCTQYKINKNVSLIRKIYFVEGDEMQV